MPRKELLHEKLTHSVIGGFYEVYNSLGFGFVENVYTNALEEELLARGHQVEREVNIVVYYKEKPIALQRLDMIVDRVLIVEAKASTALHTSAPRQLYNYLRATRLQIGLLLHFGPRATFYRLMSTNENKAPKSVQSVSSD